VKNKLTFEEFTRRCASAIAEDGEADPNTMMNLIYGHDYGTMGYNWTELNPTSKRKKEVKQIYDTAPAIFGKTGAVIAEAKAKEEQPKQQIVPEQNQMDPRLMSDQPEIINCAAFLQGHCRISGRVCTYSNADLKECNLRQYVQSDPSLWEIPFGREQDPAYMMGLRA
jgi:hypothetical protein